MRKGRYIVYYAAFFIVGNFFGDIVTLSAWAYLVLAALCAVISSRYKKLSLMLFCFFALGAAGIQTDRIPEEKHCGRLSFYSGEIKEKISDFLGTLMEDGDELAVFKALAIGDKSSISSDLKKSYRESGAMHLLALSGLHVGIIYGIISIMFSFMGNSFPVKIFKTTVILLFLWFYAIVSGLSPSISRAVLMITTYEISGLVGATRDGPSCIASSALIITLFSPESPRNIGFQLSFSAVIAIYAIFPHLRKLLCTSSRILNFLWDSICIAISCQMTCGLLGWFYFGTFPRYFLLTNIVAVPVATIIMYLIVSVLLTLTLPQFNSITLSLLEKAIHLLNSVLTYIAEL